MDLESLAQREAAVHTGLAAIHTNSDRDSAAAALRALADEYRAILDAYLALLSEPAHAGEALKRSALLAWRATARPSSMRALTAITEQQIDRVVHQVDCLLVDEREDPELRAIVSYCVRRILAPFERISPAAAVRLVLAESAYDDHAALVHIPSAPWDRGYLGYYFSTKRGV
jgi:hypothetical protein